MEGLDSWSSHNANEAANYVTTHTPISPDITLAISIQPSNPPPPQKRAVPEVAFFGERSATDITAKLLHSDMTRKVTLHVIWVT